MAAPNFNADRAARILVEATMSKLTDEEFAKRHGISDRTLRNWRSRLAEDDEFAELFLSLKSKAVDKWAGSLSSAIRSSIEFLAQAAKDCSTSDPASVHSIAGALKILADVAMTQQALDARFAGQHRPPDEADRQVATEDAAPVH
jgi:hypothetical protein